MAMGTVMNNEARRLMIQQQSIRRKFFMFDKGKREFQIGQPPTVVNKLGTQQIASSAFIPAPRVVEKPSKR